MSIPTPRPLTPAAPGEGLASAWGAGGDASDRESIQDQPLERASEGPWQVRRPARGPAPGEDDDGVFGGLMGTEVGESFGAGGLGLVGTGRGGGGTGEGTIGLGSIGTIGKGGGGGSGSGYGRGSGAGFGGARAEAKRAAKPSAPMADASPKSAGKPRPMQAPQLSPLKAGSTDDNADLKGFLKYIADARKKLGEQLQELDVDGRVLVRVVDRDGAPIPGATVSLVDAYQRELWRATTYGDGRAPIYPRLALRLSQGAADDLTVVVKAEGATERERYKGAGNDLTIALPVARQLPQELTLDVLFIIDTTGSMGDEIAQIKQSLLAVTDKIRGLEQRARLRYGAVLYRDIYDSYVTMAHPFTEDIKAFDEALRQIDAGGGGDYPESVNQGLAQGVLGMEWEPGSARVAFLIGEAPPQMRYKGDILYGESLLEALARGIRIHAVAASGLDPLGSAVFRQVAQFTRGKFIFIEYGRDLAGSAARHGVSSGDLNANNLDAIIFEQIRDELAGWGKR
ncbi:MAG: VWA domain-containing protein [Myxococcales bacterium]|nr:VWA domain-containing protein [Myxococcales bacterium]